MQLVDAKRASYSVLVFSGAAHAACAMKHDNSAASLQLHE